MLLAQESGAGVPGGHEEGAGTHPGGCEAVGVHEGEGPAAHPPAGCSVREAPVHSAIMWVFLPGGS